LHSTRKLRVIVYTGWFRRKGRY